MHHRRAPPWAAQSQTAPHFEYGSPGASLLCLESTSHRRQEISAVTPRPRTRSRNLPPPDTGSPEFEAALRSSRRRRSSARQVKRQPVVRQAVDLEQRRLRTEPGPSSYVEQDRPAPSPAPRRVVRGGGQHLLFHTRTICSRRVQVEVPSLPTGSEYDRASASSECSMP